MSDAFTDEISARLDAELNRAAQEAIDRVDSLGLGDHPRLLAAYDRLLLVGAGCAVIGALGLIGSQMDTHNAVLVGSSILMTIVGSGCALLAVGGRVGALDSARSTAQVLTKRGRESAAVTRTNRLKRWWSGPPAPLGAGHLYVIQFDTGTIKVGHTTDPVNRLSGHRRHAWAFGVTLARVWVSEAHPNHEETESDLIDFAAETATGDRARREFFHGADFDQLVEYAAELASASAVPAP